MTARPEIDTSVLLSKWFARAGVRDGSLTSITTVSLMSAYFARDEAFDAECRRYEPAIVDLIKYYNPLLNDEAELRKKIVASDVNDILAHIILLDQYTRNIWRGKDAKRVYTESDPVAFQLARVLVAAEKHETLDWLETMFIVLPYGHHESLQAQLEGQQITIESLQRARQSISQGELLAAIKILEASTSHLEIVARFGRFPHRNQFLARDSTSEELDYMNHGGLDFGTKE